MGPGVDMERGWGAADVPAGPDSIARLVPDVAPAWERLVAALPAPVDGPDPEPSWAPTVCALTQGLAPVHDGVDRASVLGWRSAPGLTDDTAAVLSFAERFATDVSAITDEDRASLFATVGAAAFDVVMGLYLGDYVPRVRAALDGLFGPGRSGWPDPGTDPATDTAPEPWPAIEAFQRDVAVLGALDPTTTELVRLRGARQHDCRLCRSLRSRSALLDGADEALFDAVDEDPDRLLSDRHRAALALADALIWQPARIPAGVLDAVRHGFTPVESVELVLDVMRNAGNKIAVALAADDPHVADGVEVYDIDPSGNPVYGLTAP